MVFIRPATRGDRDAILAFCRDTFDWGDYIEDVIDDWFDSSKGVLLVATVEGKPAGIARVAMIGATEAWFEGLRVDRQFRRLGLGRALTAACVEEARRRGATLAMIAVDASNSASLSLSEGAGFRRVARFRLMYLGDATTTPVDDCGVGGIRLATSDDMPALCSLLPRGLVFMDWEVVRWGPGLVQDMIRRACLWVLESANGLCAAALVRPDEGALFVASLCGEVQGMGQILGSAGRLAALYSCGHAYLWCIEGGADEKAALSAGFVDEARGEVGGGLFLLEMRLDEQMGGQ